MDTILSLVGKYCIWRSLYWTRVPVVRQTGSESFVIMLRLSCFGSFFCFRTGECIAFKRFQVARRWCRTAAAALAGPHFHASGVLRKNAKSVVSGIGSLLRLTNDDTRRTTFLAGSKGLENERIDSSGSSGCLLLRLAFFGNWRFCLTDSWRAVGEGASSQASCFRSRGKHG